MWPVSRLQNPSGVPGPSASVFPTHLDGAGGCQNFACLWFNQGCQPGCSECSDIAGGPVSPGPSDFRPNTCNQPNTTMSPTITNTRLRTYKDASDGRDWTAQNPWRAPGYAPVASPCGVAGGGSSPGSWMSEALEEHIVSGAVTPPFIRRGFDGRDLPEGPVTIWKQGSKQEVAWSIFQNHGGGYAYRLCPKSSNITEECFQAHHLEFASQQSWIQYGSNHSNRTFFEAVRVSEGTNPPGSTWTMNPIPSCAGPDGQPVQDPECPLPMFPPLIPGLFGDGPGACITWGVHGPVEGYHTLYDSFGNVVYQAKCTKGQGLWWGEKFQFSIFDEVAVPKDLPVGEYVLSFRLDSEQTPQVWSQCADVSITPADILAVQ